MMLCPPPTFLSLSGKISVKKIYSSPLIFISRIVSNSGTNCFSDSSLHRMLVNSLPGVRDQYTRHSPTLLNAGEAFRKQAQLRNHHQLNMGFSGKVLISRMLQAKPSGNAEHPYILKEPLYPD